MRKRGLGLGLAALLLAWGLAWAQQGPVAGTAVADTGKKLVDINTATPQELDKLPGIGEAYTRAIIEGRPYKDKRELRWKKIVPRGTFEKIKDRITAVQPKDEAKSGEAASPAKMEKSSPKLVK